MRNSPFTRIRALRFTAGYADQAANPLSDHDLLGLCVENPPSLHSLRVIRVLRGEFDMRPPLSSCPRDVPI